MKNQCGKGRRIDQENQTTFEGASPPPPIIRNRLCQPLSDHLADFRNGRRTEKVGYHQTANRFALPPRLRFVDLPGPAIRHQAVGMKRRLPEFLLTCFLRGAEYPIPEYRRTGEHHLIPIVLQHEASNLSTQVAVSRTQLDYCHCSLLSVVTASLVISLILREM